MRSVMHILRIKDIFPRYQLTDAVTEEIEEKLEDMKYFNLFFFLAFRPSTSSTNTILKDCHNIYMFLPITPYDFFLTDYLGLAL